MSFKKRIKTLAEKIFEVRIFRVLPKGIDFSHDVSNAMPTYKFKVIFDVGANVGQSTITFLDEFIDSYVYSFEPVYTTYEQLKLNVNKHMARVSLHKLALGSKSGSANIVMEGSSDMFYIKEQAKIDTAKTSSVESVKISTLDEFCLEHNIQHVSYLKIDTEGGDLEVLKGSSEMLSKQKIDFVQVEAGMSPRNKRHVAFELLKQQLESSNYYLFGIYEQVDEWITKEPNLRRTNSVFMSKKMIEEFRKHV